MLLALRTTKNQSTGMTAARILLGRELTGPGDLIYSAENDSVDFSDQNRNYAEAIAHRIKCGVRFCLENRKIAGQVQKIHYDKNHRDSEFAEGSLVWLQAHPLSSKIKGVAASLAPKREGPYKICRKINPRNYMLCHPETNQEITFAHVVQLTPYVERTVKDSAPTAPAGEQNSETIINNSKTIFVPTTSNKNSITTVPLSSTQPGRGKPRGRPRN